LKIKELIEKLAQLDEEMLVMVNGYEGGLNELKTIEIKDVALDVNDDDSYEGPHEDLNAYGNSHLRDEGHPVVKAVVLPRHAEESFPD
jgi:hypothetical protein